MDFGISLSGLDSTLDVLDYDGFGTVTYRVGSDVDYSIHVEYGTSRMEAQPYLRPAVEEVLSNIDQYADNADSLDEMIKAIAEAVADVASDKAPVDTGRLQNSITVESN